MFFFSSRRRHTILTCDWSSDVCSSDLAPGSAAPACWSTSCACGAARAAGNRACPGEGRGQGLLDVVLDPVAQPGVFALPLGKPLNNIAAHLGEIAPIVEPAQLLQTIVVDLARYIIERVSEEMHVAALPSGLGQDLADRLLQAGVIVRDNKLNPGQAARLQPEEKVAPARPALP